eukprot:jgi/Antlo1/1220/1159
MKSITGLNLHCCNISGGGIKYIQALNNLRELCVTDYTLCSDELSAIGKMQNLTILKLNRCRIEQEGLRNIRTLNALSELELSWMELCENHFAEIEKMKSLIKLDIHNCKVVLGFLKYIKSMSNLKILNICGLECCGKEKMFNRILQNFVRIKPFSVFRLRPMPLRREDRIILHELRKRSVHVVC